MPKTKAERQAELLAHLNKEQGRGWVPAKRAPGRHIWVQKGPMLLLHSWGRTPEEDSFSIFLAIPYTQESIVAHGLSAQEAVAHGLERAYLLASAVLQGVGAVTGQRAPSAVQMVGLMARWQAKKLKLVRKGGKP